LIEEVCGVFVTRVDLQKLRGFGLSVFALFLFACFADANQRPQCISMLERSQMNEVQHHEGKIKLKS
jgi:hypothetical protein